MKHLFLEPVKYDRESKRTAEAKVPAQYCDMTYTGTVWRGQRVNADSPYRTVPYRTVIVPYIYIDTDKSEKDIQVDRDKDRDRYGDREAHTEGRRESVCV
jgi:hypothetical protein